MNKILFIIGSLRNNGFNYQLSKEVYEILKDKYKISYLEYSNIPYMNQDIENPELEIIKNIRTQIMENDLLLIFTPEYNYSYPGVLKNLLDWLSRPLKYNDYNSGTAVLNKKVAVTGIGGKNKTNDARIKLLDLLKTMKMNVLEDSIGFQVNNEAWIDNKVSLSNEQLNELNIFIKELETFIND